MQIGRPDGEEPVAGSLQTEREAERESAQYFVTDKEDEHARRPTLRTSPRCTSLISSRAGPAMPRPTDVLLRKLTV